MEERIKEYLDQYLNSNPGRTTNEWYMREIKANAKSFQVLTEKLGYDMKFDITEEGTFIIQFCSTEGLIYTTYSFHNIINAT